MKPQDVSFRDGAPADASDLAILADAAGRRIVSWIWDGDAAPGESSFDLGRTVIRSAEDNTTHHSYWRVAEINGEVVGGLNSHLMAPSDSAYVASQDEVVRSLLELKAMAVGTWYISVAAVFPELRGRGIGTKILAEAELVASAAGINRMSLMVVSANQGALRLYERFGYSEWARDAFVPFPGSDPSGDWILMAKDL